MTSVITSITNVFTAMIEWIAGTFQKIVPIFYDAESGLTFLGTLSVVALAISVFLLLMGLIQRFLHFAG